MSQKEELKREAKEALAGGKTQLAIVKNIIRDKKTKQFSIKLPKEIALAAKLTSKSKLKIIVNPTKEEIEEVSGAHLIIYEEEKEKPVA